MCINCAGSFGCMSAMNDSASIGDGHIVGVNGILIVDRSDWCVRDGGAVPIQSLAAPKNATKER